MATMQSQKAEHYLRCSEALQVDGGLKLLETLKPNKGDLVLDLGCGTGNLSVVIAEKVGAKGRVVAVDPDKHRIAVARETFGDIENIEFEEGSSENLLSFGKASFDAVFMNYVLHFIEDKKVALKSIYEVLKPGGQLAMLFNITLPPLLEKTVKDLNPEENFKRFRELYFFENLGQIKSYCEDAGFVISKSAEIINSCLHKDLSQYLMLVSATTFGIFDINLVQEAKRKTFELFFDKEGGALEDFPIGIIIATKRMDFQF